MLGQISASPISFLKKKSNVAETSTSKPSTSSAAMPKKIGTGTVSESDLRQLISRMEKTERDLPEASIEGLYISIIDSSELVKYGVVNVTEPSVRGLNGVNDPRMGVTEPGQRCGTCTKTVVECPGHLGYIKLNEPVIHPLFLRTIIRVLACTCRSCGGLLLTKEQIEALKLDVYSGPKRLELIEKACENLLCIRRQEAGAKPCQRNPIYLPSDSKEAKRIVYAYTEADKKSKNTHTMSMEELVKILSTISEEDAKLLGFINGSHPLRMIITAWPVMPPIARPPSLREGEIYQDNLTDLYIHIVEVNNKLANKQLKEDDRRNLYNLLVFYLEHFVDNADKKYTVGRKEIAGIKQRIQGKEAIIRSLMQGKRVDYTARTVVGPDPRLRHGQVRVPRIFAPYLTQIEIVADWNRERLQSLLEMGRVTHVRPGSGAAAGRLFFIWDHDRKRKLNIGDEVHRWLQDGDYVIYNRQPTLHKQSFQAAEVVIGEEMTIGIPLPETTGFNADFDGDEMNLHAPQDPAAMIELKYLMNSRFCSMNAQTNKPIIAPTFNAILGAYILSDPELEIDREDYDDAMSEVKSTAQLSTLDERLRKHNVEKYSGPGLFSSILPANFVYSRGPVQIIDGVLVFGRIDKSHIGNSDGSIPHLLYIHYSLLESNNFTADLTSIINSWLPKYGYTIGLDECLLDASQMRRSITSHIEKRKRQIRKLEVKDKKEQLRELLQSEINKTERNFEYIKQRPDDPYYERDQYAYYQYHRFLTGEAEERYIGVESERISALVPGGEDEGEKMFQNLQKEFLRKVEEIEKTPDLTEKEIAERKKKILQYEEDIKKNLLKMTALSKTEMTDKDLEILGVTREQVRGMSEEEKEKLKRSLYSEKYAGKISLDEIADPRERMKRILKIEYEKAKSRIEALGPMKEDPFERQKQEEQIIAYLNNVAVIGKRIMGESMTSDNSLRIAVVSGAKGSEFNIAQITGNVGQQFFRGKRIEPKLPGERTLPFFPPGSSMPEARGYINKSFSEGLSAPDMFFLHTAGREGLIDTALKTQDTGSVQRQLIKASEDFKVAYDGSVRNANKIIYQAVYGNDGFDGANLLSVKDIDGSQVAVPVDPFSLAAKLNAAYAAYAQ